MTRATLLTLFLAGCAVRSPDYVNLAVTNTQAKQDAYACERDMRSAQRTNSCTATELYMRCMESKGYRAVEGTGHMVCPPWPFR